MAERALCRESRRPVWFLGHISPCVLSLGFLLHKVGIADSFPTLTLVGKEASVDVICVVLSSAVGDVKLGPNVPSSTQGIDPVKGRSHYKEIHCQVPPPTSSLEQFSALREFRGLGQKARANAFRAREGRPAGPRQQRQPRKTLEAGAASLGFLDSLCSHSFSGIHPCVKPEKGSQLTVGQTWSGHTVVCSFAQIPASSSEVSTVLSHTVCWALLSSLQVSCPFQR